MLSRVADSLFWMARNVERADNNARLIAVKLISQLENANHQEELEDNWEELIQISGYQSQYSQQYEKITDRNVIEFLFFSSKNPNSVFTGITIARENAKAVREIIPQELWEMLNSFYLEIKECSESSWEIEKVNDYCELVKNRSLLFQGIVEATLQRGDAYLFMEMGKYIERAEKTSRILDVFFHKNLESYKNVEIVTYHHWWSVLQSVSGHEAYIKTYRPLINDQNVAEFLIFNPSFPRSMYFCIQKVKGAFEMIEDHHVEHYSKSLFEALEYLENDLTDYTIEEVIAHGPHSFLQSFQNRCNKIGQLIAKTYYLGEVTVT
ncbi:alpha-E domain-containing protein [Pseudalkalibacillus caeni]|uniref:Alpha-E domain-containing protein n=1 Tax=Exobacillus caeni TaxID=2574798 RepID=A0A5R9FEN5_9BACL|nr:alpha-E domain-containing protein [Pseudalkalibacillus caeni]TLS39044.1 alpha-E domain-containing protein [Pseudalkalibacillus caeni]